MISKARVYVILYAVLLGAHVALVWCVPYFPTQDGPSHVYNSVILHDLLHGKGNWANFYSANVQVFPNLGFPMLAYPLLSVLQPLAVERAFITAYVLLLGVAVPVFLRAMGSAAWPLSFFLFVVIFNKMFLMGFYSNAIGVPALLLAVALAWRIRHRPIAVRALWLNVAGAVLLLIHLIPFALFLLGVAVMVAVDANDWKESVRRVIVTGGVMLPSVLFAVSLIIPNMGPSIPSTWSSSLGELVRGLVIFSGESYSRWQLLPGVLALLVIAAAGIEAGRQFRRERKQRDAVDSSSPFLATFCGLLMIVYFSAPDDFLGGALFKMRLPWVILLLALPIPRAQGTMTGALQSTLPRRRRILSRSSRERRNSRWFDAGYGEIGHLPGQDLSLLQSTSSLSFGETGFCLASISCTASSSVGFRSAQYH